MARNKHAPALFDVIHRDVRRRSPLRNHRTPLTWIRERLAARQASRGTVAVVTDDHNDPTRRPHPLLHGLGMHELDSDRLPPSVALAPPPQATIAPPAPVPAPAPAVRPRVPQVQVDGTRQIIRFSLTYTSAGVAAFSLLVMLCLAYYVGRSTASAANRPLAAAITTEQLRAGPANPAVLDVSASPRATVADRVSVAGSTPPAPPAPTAAAADGQRIVGMNYVIVQSYPEQEDARQAAEVLRQHGVPATVVKGTAFAPRWYSVVGMQPFDRLSNNPEYAAYVKRIKQISDKFERNPGFKKFEPRPYQWR